ncbi:hypothetical protein [Kitasatospora aureofaciens]|uniref:hypothetical protein n=1 Tax=Kitasatospora aureofaciens TaxID=1894 RepID=UPI001C45000D|nr:hypothetical protein [Kitasatospora aureofaciens]MBV6700642.1 hypothetical protein [Kitasatospora aureofaciens]
MTDDLDDCRDIAGRHRHGLRDPRRLVAAYAVSLTGICAFVSALLTICRTGS